MQGNIIGQDISGNSNLLSNLNIFTQPNEPSEKNGIWIQTPTDYEYENIQFVPNSEVAISDYTELARCPISPGGCATVGTDIYLFYETGGYGTSTSYKYDTLTNVYTGIHYMPFKFIKPNGCAAVGTDIYLFDYTDSKKYCYKYDTLTDTYTAIAQIPLYGSIYSNAVVGTNIYLFSLSLNYKYDTLTDTYTRMENLPEDYYKSVGAVAIGSNIYLIDNSYTGDIYEVYIYNTETNTYITADTRLTGYDKRDSAVIGVGTDIYIIGGQYKDGNYKYDTVLNTYTSMESLPLTDTDKEYCAFDAEDCIAVVGTDIYLFNIYDKVVYGQITTSTRYFDAKYNTIKAVSNKTVLILVNKKLFKTSLNENINIYISGANIYDNDALQEYPSYYGDGEKWNLMS